MGVKCFYLEETKRFQHYLRRWHRQSTQLGSEQPSRHDAYVVIGEAEHDSPYMGFDLPDAPPHDDPRWPQCCSCGCGYEFLESDGRQARTIRLFRRSDTGALVTTDDAGPGAIYNASWYQEHPCWSGPDGLALMAVLPNGHRWHIDGIASNCTDFDGAMAGKHKCWVRHGLPPNLTVDKNGVTCNAGAGSIMAGNYHGFLRNGEFTDS